MRQRFSICAALAVILVAADARAHDFWIEPGLWRAEVGQEVAVALRVGERFQGDPVPRNRERIDRFVIVGPDGERSVPGNDGSDPAGFVSLKAPGTYVIGYRSRRASIELEPAKFESYLREEGLESVIAERNGRGESAKPGIEVYSRCAKSLLIAGAAPGAGYDRVLGLRLELVPEANPYDLKPGGELPVMLLYENQPLEGALVVALCRDEPQARLAVRTDPQGRAVFPLSQRGTWMIKTVHMVPAPEGTGADWESLWASLTFALP